MILFQTFGVFILFTLVGVPLVYGLLLATVGMIWWAQPEPPADLDLPEPTSAASSPSS